ncbi:MAG TPA: hypothetical protein VGS19_20795 [Streptosporangiaceae bacterium]|nr:hypothetical protein [Streptosporangiaceae bacterium]
MTAPAAAAHAGPHTEDGGVVLPTGGLLRNSATGWASSAATASVAAGAVLLAGFAVLQHRPTAMLDRRLLRDRSVAAVSLATITLSAGMFAVILYLTIFLQGACASARSPAGSGCCPSPRRCSSSRAYCAAPGSPRCPGG